MNSWLSYLLKASFSVLPFYAIYLLFLRRLTFFRWNRLFLLGSLIFSFIIPLLTLPVLLPVGGHIPVVTAVLTGEIAKITTPLPDRTTVAVSSFSWMQAIQWIYLAGAMIMLIRFLLSLWQVYKMIRCGQIERSGRYRIVSGENIQVNASFFRFIFLKQQLSAGEKQSILIHEGIHARKGHSADILLVEILKVICWFHPAIYHYGHLLQRAHEFEVDSEMTGRADKKEYAALLLGLQSPRRLALTNLFSASELKERIRMLFAEKSTSLKRVLYLLLLPCLMITLFTFCNRGIKNSGQNSRNGLPSEIQLFNDSNELVYYPNIKAIATRPGYDDYVNNIYPKVRDAFLKAGVKLDHAVKWSKDTLVLLGFQLTSLNGGESAGATFRVAEMLKNNYRIRCRVDKYSHQIFVQSMTNDISTAKILNEVNSSKIIDPEIKNGKKLFQTNCAACHSIFKNMTGPAMIGMDTRYSKEWIYKFIQNPPGMLANGDTDATKLYDKFKPTVMTSFPNLSHQEVDAILAYVNYTREQAAALGVEP